MVTKAFDDVQRGRLVRVFVLTIVLSLCAYCDLAACVYYKLVSSFSVCVCVCLRACVCMCWLSGIYQWLVQTVRAQSFVSTAAQLCDLD